MARTNQQRSKATAAIYDSLIMAASSAAAQTYTITDSARWAQTTGEVIARRFSSTQAGRSRLKSSASSTGMTDPAFLYSNGQLTLLGTLGGEYGPGEGYQYLRPDRRLFDPCERIVSRISLFGRANGEPRDTGRRLQRGLCAGRRRSGSGDIAAHRSPSQARNMRSFTAMDK